MRCFRTDSTDSTPKLSDWMTSFCGAIAGGVTGGLTLVQAFGCCELTSVEWNRMLCENVATGLLRHIVVALGVDAVCAIRFDDDLCGV